MARELLDYDQWTGIATYTEYDDSSGRMAVHQETDVAPLLDAMQRRRIEGFSDRGIEGHMKHYCNLDMITIMALKKKGIDVFNLTKETFPAFAREIETNYPLLKATDMKAWRPKGAETTWDVGALKR